MKKFKIVLIVNFIIAISLYIGTYCTNLYEPQGVFAGLDPMIMVPVVLLLAAIAHTILEIIGVMIYLMLKDMYKKGKIKGEDFVSVQRYPYSINMYKGEERILVIPVINHLYGYSVNADWFVNISDLNDSCRIGETILEAFDFIKGNPLSTATPKELDENAAWKKNSKCKTETSFWKNNHYVRVNIMEDQHYRVYSMTRSEKLKCSYSAVIKEISLPPEATADELGKAVIEVFEASEEYYKDYKEPTERARKDIELLDESKLTFVPPSDEDFEDFGDCHAAEIYQCYSYIPETGSESSADIFLSMAPELDCSLEEADIKGAWRDTYGEADCFDLKDVEHGIFKLRVEMRNKEKHKISYLLQQEEDLLLECSMEVHQPNRRKKLDEKMEGWFEEFVLSCKFE